MGDFEHLQHAPQAAGPRANHQTDGAAPGRAPTFDPPTLGATRQATPPTDMMLAMLRGDREVATAEAMRHADEPVAAAATQELDAEAFSTGQDVFFGARRPRAPMLPALTSAAKAPSINGGTTGARGLLEPLDRFRHALAAGDAAAAGAAWATISPTDLLKLKGDSDTLVKMVRVIGPDSIAMLHTIGVTPAADRRMAHAILHHGATTWVDALDSHGMLDEFLRAPPRRKELNLGALSSLAEYTRKDQPTAKAAFEKAYAELREGDFTSGGGTAHGVAWDQDHIRRAYLALQAGIIPASHLAGLSGIYIASHHTSGASGRRPLGYGYFAPATKTIVLPLYAGDGASVHKMVGSGTPEAPPLKHFTATLLHEVGHHVGEMTGEHDWGERADSPLRMEASSALEMRDELWDPALLIVLTEEGAQPVSDDDAKLYLESQIRGTHDSIYPSTAWAKAGKEANSKRLFLANLDKQFREQPLYKMAKAIAGKLSDGYLHAMPGVKTPTKMFAYLSRFNAHSPWAKYERAAFDAKPSWYAVSSAKEWFAEHYTLYQTSRRAPLPAVEAKFKAIVSQLETTLGSSHNAASAASPATTIGASDPERSTPPHMSTDSAVRAASAAPLAGESQIHRFELQW